MKYAIVSVSETGARLGARITKRLDGEATLFEREGAASGERAIYFKSTFALTKKIFSQFDRILYIMAIGIVVRAIAPLLVSKARDPAVLVMDECGLHCVSLLSGHLGGANEWAREVAASCGGDPVITTATDVHGRLAPDDAARKLMMRIEPLSALKKVNSMIAEGKRFAWFVDPAVSGTDSIQKRLSEIGVDVSVWNELDFARFDACAIISERVLSLDRPHVYLRPRNLFVGIGCKRGTETEYIEEAFRKGLALIGASEYQVKSLASVSLKADEKGLLSFAEGRNLPIHFYTPRELRIIEDLYHMEKSGFVEKTIGVGNVCQTAALKEAGKGKTLLPKTKFPKVTIAIASGLSV